MHLALLGFPTECIRDCQSQHAQVVVKWQNSPPLDPGHTDDAAYRSNGIIVNYSERRTQIPCPEVGQCRGWGWKGQVMGRERACDGGGPGDGRDEELIRVQVHTAFKGNNSPVYPTVTVLVLAPSTVYQAQSC